MTMTGVTDVEENNKGSNPKDPNSKPAVAPTVNTNANDSRGKLPKTGYDTNIGYTAFTAISGLSLGLLALKKKKRR